jgi:hypothetical protein
MRRWRVYNLTFEKQGARSKEQGEEIYITWLKGLKGLKRLKACYDISVDTDPF